jgi:23S rRNA (cytidine1920-2'-O)/16S rRNA (cytidine1409-2'-O)-methyltransferase
VRRRLDVEMVRRAMAVTRSEAGLAIRSGKVTVGGRPAAKAGMLVGSDEPIALAAPARRFVSRGGEKLEAALDRFGVDVAGRVALDAGASTGGFTDCLLQRGAARVIAVDVGYGQLDWRLREDPRVVVMERTNVRDLQPGNLARAPHLADLPDLVTADLSFISLRLAIPALARCAAPRADLVFLVKPQFEAGRDEVRRGGVVTDPAVWKRVVRSVAEACGEAGFDVLGVGASPLVGPAGNVEFLLHARRDPGQLAEPGGPEEGMISRAVEEGGRMGSARGEGGRIGSEGGGDG